MGTCFAALMCHAPIVHPEVGRDEAVRCQRTTTAMRQVAARAVVAAPDRLVLISPHTPRRRHTAGRWEGPVRGDLSRFRAPQVAVDLPEDPLAAALLDLPTVGGEALDHGAVVPLAFLWEAGWRGPTTVLSLPAEEGPEAALGRAIAALPGRVAVIASGDMSHRLKPGAPSGYDPLASRFDGAFVEALRRGDRAAALAAPHRDRAAEDVVASVTVAMAAAPALHEELLAYEGPWGVGYAEAILHDPAPPAWAVAQAAMRAAVRGEAYTPPAGGPPACGLFVTLHRGGELRGCIGHMWPTTERLYAELAEVAPLSALRDPRFPRVTEAELDELALELSLMEPPEPATLDQLDPAVFGVVVHGHGRRGVLLPALDGIVDVDHQVAIATRKAGLPPGGWERLERFRVRVEHAPS
jgi:AmmeMemoRadiSam system protein A